MEQVVHGFEIVGVAILVACSTAALAGCVLAIMRGATRWSVRTGPSRRGARDPPRAGGVIIADIVLTITAEPTVESALTLGLVVLVRTLLNFSLEIELEGALPWRRPDRPTDRL
jgi:prepilin signal peptidase PulO-like enzyme (type II secretory pathway)